MASKPAPYGNIQENEPVTVTVALRYKIASQGTTQVSMYPNDVTLRRCSMGVED
jgi:hypothetical protein